MMPLQQSRLSRGWWLITLTVCLATPLYAQPTNPRSLPTDFSEQTGVVLSAGEFDDPSAVDYWVFTAPPGMRLELEVDRNANEIEFDPFVWLFAGTIANQSHFQGGAVAAIDSLDPGFVKIADDGVGPFGWFQTQDPRLTVDLTGSATTYTVIVGSFISGTFAPGTFSLADGGDGLYGYRIRAKLIPIVPTTVVGSHLFYNNSFFDSNNLSPTPQDDAAIASDKQPYRAGRGQAATFQSYSNYSRGINGVMVDIANPPGTPTLSDFEFKIGNSNALTSWSAPSAVNIVSATVRRGAGVMGSDRVTIIFADNAIRNQWLQVRVRATAQTGIAADDVHYWGHQAGEVGNESGLTRVNTADTSRIGANFSTFQIVPTNNPFDLNRDGRVNTLDYSYSQSTYTGFTSLVLISLP